MRPFSLELAYVSGWHDGERVHIVEPQNQHVILHEEVHTDILRCTPDGQFLWFSILFRSTCGSGHPSGRQELINEHIENSREAQECFATYIGSKLFINKSDRIKARGELSAEYRAYYLFLHDMLAPIATSDFLKVALATAIQQVTFSSRSVLEWTKEDFDYRTLLRDPPDRRLKIFRGWWSDDGRQATTSFLRECLASNSRFVDWCRRQGSSKPLFEIIDDDDRLHSDRAFARELDAWLIPRLVAFVANASPLEVLTDEEWQEALELVVREARRRGVPLELEPGFDDLRAGDYRMSGTADARVYITPSRGELSQSAERLDGDAYRAHLGSQATILGTVFSHSDQLPQRCDIDFSEIEASTDDGAIQVGFAFCRWISTEDAIRGLQGHAEAVQKKNEPQNLGCVVIPKSRSDILRRLESCDLNRHVSVYLDEGVFDFILEHPDNFAFGIQQFQATDQPILSALWGRPKTKVAPHVLKCMPQEAGRLLFAHLVRRGDVEITEEQPPPMILEAIRLVTSYWTWI